MKIGNFDTDQKVFVIAEIGNNHEGSLEEAKKLVQAAAGAGANAVKFQTFVPALYASADQVERLARLKKFALRDTDWIYLAEFARESGLVFFSTPFDLISAERLNSIQEVFKISSGDNLFWPLIEKVASFGKPTLISTGLTDADSLKKVVRFWGEKASLDRLALLHCVASYPTPNEEANLAVIRVLSREFPQLTLGYSDHTLGIEAVPLAVAAGARIVEKHFTLDKNRSSFRDHQISADPAELKSLVSRIRAVESQMGTGLLEMRACELASAKALRRSIAASRPLEKNTLLQIADLTWVRPGVGIPPGSENRLLGRRLNKSKHLGELILEEDLSPA